MPRRKATLTPPYKLLLLCKSCNSYLSTFAEVTDKGALLLWCEDCGMRAGDLDEVREVPK
jgi:hypothetical protein